MMGELHESWKQSQLGDDFRLIQHSISADLSRIPASFAAFVAFAAFAAGLGRHDILSLVDHVERPVGSLATESSKSIGSVTVQAVDQHGTLPSGMHHIPKPHLSALK